MAGGNCVCDRRMLASIIVFAVSFGLIFISLNVSSAPAPAVYHTLNEIFDITGLSIDSNNNNVVDWTQTVSNIDRYTCQTGAGVTQGTCTQELAHQPKMCMIEGFRNCLDCSYSVSGSSMLIHAHDTQGECACKIVCIY